MQYVLLATCDQGCFDLLAGSFSCSEPQMIEKIDYFNGLIFFLAVFGLQMYICFFVVMGNTTAIQYISIDALLSRNKLKN